MVAADGQKPGVFPLRARVRLERDCCEAGDGSEPVFKLHKHFAVSGCLVGWSIRVEVAHFRPAEWHHLGRCIELHGAASEGNHRVVEGDVLPLKATQVAHHFGLCVVGIEDRVAQEVGSSKELGRK